MDKSGEKSIEIKKEGFVGTVYNVKVGGFHEK